MSIESREHFEHGNGPSPTHITIRDLATGGRAVLVNGEEVTLAEDGIYLDCADGEATTLTLRILPATIVFE